MLTPIWQQKPATASRIRGRIEVVLDYAAARGWRERGVNPAQWRGNLQHLLPAARKLRAIQHFVALDWHEAPAFMAKLREVRDPDGDALEGGARSDVGG